MEHLKKFLQGTFRGVPFNIDSHTFNGGRRSPQHEFVDREKPYTEDVGRKANSFQIECYVLGDDYFDQRDALSAALSLKGDGDLIHPYLGTKKVNVDSFSFTESAGEGRVARFSITFLETGLNEFPTIGDDPAGELLDSADAALASAKDEFTSKYSVLSQPGYVVEAARAGVEKAADAFTDATKVIADTSNDITELAFAARNLKAEALTLIQQPSLLADRLLDAITLLSSVAKTAEDANNAFGTMYDFGEDDTEIVGNTGSREQQKLNQDSFNVYVKRMAILRSSQEQVDVDFFSVDDANKRQEQLVGLLEDEKEITDSNDFFQDASDVQSGIVKNVPNLNNELPNIVTVVPNETTNSLVLTYDLFEDATKEQEIIDRNNITNPAFVAGGEPLEILNA